MIPAPRRDRPCRLPLLILVSRDRPWRPAQDTLAGKAPAIDAHTTRPDSVSGEIQRRRNTPGYDRVLRDTKNLQGFEDTLMLFRVQATINLYRIPVSHSRHKI